MYFSELLDIFINVFEIKRNKAGFVHFLGLTVSNLSSVLKENITEDKLKNILELWFLIGNESKELRNNSSENKDDCERFIFDYLLWAPECLHYFKDQVSVIIVRY